MQIPSLASLFARKRRKFQTSQSCVCCSIFYGLFVVTLYTLFAPDQITGRTCVTHNDIRLGLQTIA